MKQFVNVMIICIFSMLVLSTCGGNGGNSNAATDSRTLNHFIQAFEDEFEFREQDTPLYIFIGASSGVMWHGVAEVHPVSIYEFETTDALKEAISSNTFMSDWVTNGRFVIETNLQEANNFFATIE